MKHLIVVISTIISLVSCSSKNSIEFKKPEILVNLPAPVVREVLLNGQIRTEITFSGTIINTGGYTNDKCIVGFYFRTNPSPGSGDPTVMANITDGNIIVKYCPNVDKLAYDDYLQPKIILPNTIYYVRMFCSNPTGISYSSVVSFTTPNTIK
jgi:hypothetical protein